MPTASKLLCCVLLLSGCSALNHRNAEAARARQVNEIAKFANVRTIEELDRRLNALCDTDDAQQKVELLIEGWGQHGSWYDLAVVKFFVEQFPSAYGRNGRDCERFDLQRLFNVTDEVLRKHPEFVFQLFWYEQWKSGPEDFSRLMQRIEPPAMRGCVRLRGEEYALALWLAGVVEGLPFERQPGGLILEVRWDNLELDEAHLRQAILAQRPFLRYDHELGRWIVDQEAKKGNRYLTPAEQQASPRPIPLPNWDSDVIPPRPIHEPESKEEVKLLGIPD
ncbi:MAG: hypothetical protein FD138_3871 [Planctomycetota bacterium]|nr:MAG: hypothetical protein FD138_3871 [Planctomycetota bacterium]